ncbi:HigA family addiction module antitoxin [Pedobacter glucosidilyticus]|uniref:HigA family addiction module antitoxin n=1 Tax=Pedobacter glucosidilyticus TaxID=1122941 RepID=UPI0026ED5E7B|nr:HigA family addiction module antitoxin [Pedobacter glucosidilyticus]
MFAPAHPGELIKETIEELREETSNKLTLEEVAAGLEISKTLSTIINHKQSISLEMALKLAKAFNTSLDFWLRAQENYNLAQAKKK